MSDAFTPGLLTRLSTPPAKVAVVRASRIGDFVCATPAFRALRAALPDAELALVALPFARELVARSRHLDRFEEFPGWPGIAEQLFEPRRAARFLERMQAERFDLAIQLHGSGVFANPFTLLLGARSTAGFVRPGDPAGRLDAALPVPAEGHEVQRVLALPAFLGAEPHGEETELPLWPEDEAEADALLADAERPLLGVHAGGWGATKRWPPRRFAACVRELRRRLGGSVVVVGASGDRPLSAEIAWESGEPLVDLAGRTSLPVLAAVLARLAVFVTTDSGPAHVAYAVGTPTVTVFGGTDPARWDGRGGAHAALAHPVRCRPCDYEECPIGYACLEAVGVAEVVDAAEAAASRYSIRSGAFTGGGSNVVGSSWW